MRLILFLALLLSAAAAPAAPVMRVHLLGTGGPELTPDRQGYATLIETPDDLLLFDAGRGLIQRIYEQRINPKRVTRVFLTHLHSDHISGLPELWMTPWFLLGRSAPLEVWGPPGTRDMIAGMRAMYGHDVAHRTNAFNPAAAIAVTVHEIADGVVYDHAGLRVIAFPVEHADGDPAFGYRIEREGHAAVLSGDTTWAASLAKAAKGADLIVQNVIAFSPRLTAMPEMQGVLAKLTTPEQAARLFEEARPTLAIFSHIVKKELAGEAGDAVIVARVRAAGYQGLLAMGHDREVVEIGETVTVVPAASLEGLPDLDSKSARF
ncbi:MAG: fold metallo-hydrolase [Rhizorhabdus sp.]|nr:fold metallo-hydrolase [Rhizorhabdus sp.]